MRNGTVPLTIVRGGKTLSVALPLVADRPYLVRQLSGTYPEYFIYGPLVFSRAALEHLQSVFSPTMLARPRAVYGMFQSPLFQQLGLPPTAEREALVFSRKELVAATERILTNNGVRAQGSPDMMEVWQGR